MSSDLPEINPEHQLFVGKGFKRGHSSHKIDVKPKHGKKSSSREKKIKMEADKATLGELARIKDMVHFILSYPVKLLPDELNYSNLRGSIPKLERGILTLLMDDNRTSFPRCDLSFSLDRTYIPERWRSTLEYQKRIYSSDLSSHGPPVEQIPSWVIKSAIRQASHCILEAGVRLIAITGQEAWQVTKALIDVPEMQFNFDAFIYISVRQHLSISEKIDEILLANSSTLSIREVKTNKLLLMLNCTLDNYTIDWKTMKSLMDRDFGCIVIATYSDDIYQTTVVDRGIRMEYHLLPLELFLERAVGEDVHHLSTPRREAAFKLLEQCHGDLDAVLLLADELLKASDDAIWKLAVDELNSGNSSHVEEGVSKPMIRVLTFIWKHKDAITKCIIQQCALDGNQGELTTISLVSSWLTGALIQTQAEGVDIINRLIKSRLLVMSYPSVISMPKEIKDVLLKYVIPLCGSPLKVQATFDDAEIINLENSEVIELPDSPNCPLLVNLCLQNNYDLMMIPPLFFKHMPILLTLNLSYTNIMTLPESISALVSLRRLILRGCDLFLELPCEVGNLTELEMIDLEGTKVTRLPSEISQLGKLQCLKLSFHARGTEHRGSMQRIPKGVLSNLDCLEELWIGVNPDEDDDEWIADIENILLYLPKRFGCNILTNIMLYLPDARLLDHLSDRWGNNYKLIVGRRGQHMLSRIPHEVEEKFKQQRKYLHYVNGECIPAKIKDILKLSDAFILERHWSVQSLSDFGTESIFWLKLCLLVECNELQIILDKDDKSFQHLEYLYIYYMKNLRSISSGQVNGHSLYSLKYLSLSTCAVLNCIFTINLLSNLPALEELVVEDCPKIESLVTQDCERVLQGCHFLPNLMRVSLRELPGLVSISNGLKMAPKLEKLVVFYCPNLHSISEVIGGNLKVIKGEPEWWDSLSWHETDKLASLYVPLERDGDLMAQFTED